MLYKRFFDQAPIGLIFVNCNVECVAVNDSAAVLLKHAPEDLAGRPIRDIFEEMFGPDVAREAEEQSRHSLLQSEPCTIPSLSSTPNQRPHVLFSSDWEIRRICGEDGEVLGAVLAHLQPMRVALFRELKLAEEERERLLLEKTEAEARASERRRIVQERLQLIAETNHHIRNALEVIQLSARSAKDAEAIELIDQQVRRIEWVLREIVGEPEEHV